MSSTIQLLTCLVLMVSGAHAAWGIGSRSPVDCSTSGWTQWSNTTVFAGQQTRTREVLRRAANGGTKCPSLIDTKFNKTLIMTTKQTAESMSTYFLKRPARVLSGTKKKSILSQTPTPGKLRDLLVILDSSGSIGNPNFTLAVTQIADLLGFMCPDPKPFRTNAHKLAVIRYSSQAMEMFNFNDYTTHDDTINAVKNIQYIGGGTNTAQAFNLARDMLVQPSYGARIGDPRVKQEVLILTDGHSNNPDQSISAAQSLKSKADIFGLVIGLFSIAGQNEILQYVSNPIQQHLFSLPSFRELKTLVDHVRASVGTQLCAPFKI